MNGKVECTEITGDHAIVPELTMLQLSTFVDLSSDTLHAE